MFSGRVPRSLETNRITRAVRHAREAAHSLIDLTTTNPTTVGIEYPADILQPLGDPEGLVYRPQPFGLAEARGAVTRDYERKGVRIDPDRIVLTASTSEAYSLLFKLLCAPAGDGVMVPVPSYPLFEHLTMLDGVERTAYRLEYHGRWALVADDLDRCWRKNTRAVLAVSPNNPTGSVLDGDELGTLSSLCHERRAALILDEVFGDYPLSQGSSSPALIDPQCLTSRLGGLSKSAGLPQVKLGWIGVEGPDHLVADALERLEVISDAYLSVSTPVQVAAPALIETGAVVRARILERIVANYDTLQSTSASHPSVDVLTTEAGWSTVIRVPATRSEEQLVLELLERDHVLVHPGFFFDFPHEAFVVVSLLPQPDVFREGVQRLLERADV
jgi:aspartate/methionine/tyrosine aminotransferase